VCYRTATIIGRMGVLSDRTGGWVLWDVGGSVGYGTVRADGGYGTIRGAGPVIGRGGRWVLSDQLFSGLLWDWTGGRLWDWTGGRYDNLR